MIEFKAKVQTVYHMDDTVAYTYVSVPNFTRSHCDIAAFRKHPKYSGLVNSDLFKNVLARIKTNVAKNGVIRLDRLPEGCEIDTSGFLAKVKLTIV